MRRRVTACMALLSAIALAIAASGASAGGGTITVDNRSAHAIKIAVPDVAATVVEPGQPPAAIRVEGQDGAVGTTVRVWWVSDPLQLCQIVTPWERTVMVTGDVEIHCRSRDPGQ